MAPPNPDQENNAIYNSAAIKSKYARMAGDFAVTRYPPDLASSEHPHYVMFFINLRSSDLKDMEKKPDIAKVSFNNSNQNRMNTEGQDLAKTGALMGGAAGVALGGAGGRAAGGLADIRAGGSRTNAILSFKNLGNITGKVVGGAGGAAAGALAFGTQERQQVLLQDVIALYLPGKPSSTFSASWAEEELGAIGGLAVAKTEKYRGEKTASDMMSSAVMKAAETQGNGALGNAAKTYESTAALTPNPFKAQLFKNMKFRTFTFDYVFLPKSKAEYGDVKSIIQTFKKYMHPRVGSTKYIMRYPAEFNIAYYFKDAMNIELFRISNCALTDLTVEYGGTDFTTFKGTKGAPTEISMKMKFTELEMLSQERFDAEAGF